MDVRFERFDTRLDKMQAQVDDLQRSQDRAAGGLNLGKWVIGALSALPFLGAALGYYVGGSN